MCWDGQIIVWATWLNSQHPQPLFVGCQESALLQFTVTTEKANPPHPPPTKQPYISSGLDEAGVGRYCTYLRTMELDHCLVQVEDDSYWD